MTRRLRWRLLWVSVVALLASLAGWFWMAPPPAPVQEDGFYVWQRLWNDKVVEAVRAESGPLFPLVCELRGADATPEWCRPDWRLIQSAGAATPVVRMDVAALASPRRDANLASVLANLAERLAPGPVALQLDVDCPESRLAEYAGFLARVRKSWPTAELSITALPCHLDNDAFTELLRQVDYYVLQLHGLEVPHTIDDSVSLMDPLVVKRALAKAAKIGVPYRVALPCYAYELNFDTASGRFHHLNAEAWRGADAGMTVRLLDAKPRDVARLVCGLRKPSVPPHFRGIVWFRLPVPGDRLAWDRRTVARLQRGEIPKTGCASRWRQGENGVWELWLENRGVLGHRQVRLLLEWEAPAGDSDTLAGFAAGKGLPGLLPSELRGPPPPPGMTRKVAWFRPENGQSAKTVVVHLETLP